MHDKNIEFARKILVDTAEWIREGRSVQGLMGMPPYSPMFSERLAQTETRIYRRIRRDDVIQMNPSIPKQTCQALHRNSEPAPTYHEDQAIIATYRTIARIEWPLRQVFVLHYVRRPALSQDEIAAQVFASRQAIAKSLRKLLIEVSKALVSWRESSDGGSKNAWMS